MTASVQDVLAAPEGGLIELNEAAEEQGKAPSVLGDFLIQIRPLTPEDLDRISQYQQQKNLRFGEAAVALGLVSQDDVLQALAQQFRYKVADEEGRRKRPELVVLNQPFGHQAEAFRAVRSQYLLHVREHHARSEHRPLAIVSPKTEDGKSFFCANLGAALAQLSGRVLLIDANLRRPRLHEMFGLNNRQGLSAVLSGHSPRGVVHPISGIENLFVMPVGVVPPNPQELIEGMTFRLLLNEVSKRFDHVLVDTASHSEGMDAVVTTSRCGSALVVSKRNANKMSDLQELTEMITSVQADLVGVVINDF